MARTTPDGVTAVLAIGDARMRVWQRLASDGRICADDEEALLLIDTAAYWFNESDLNRRKRQSYENDGQVNHRLLREERELRQEYAHVRERIAA